jgi:hypothetical protein
MRETQRASFSGDSIGFFVMCFKIKKTFFGVPVKFFVKSGKFMRILVSGKIF